jgi:uncharacterized protein (TIGR02145 family)
MKNFVLPAVFILGLMFWGCEKENPMDMNSTLDDPFMPTKSLGIEILGSETGSISGNVFFAGCKVPIPGVSIAINENTAVSAPDGSFCLESIPEGTHSMVVCKDDFESCCQEVIISKDIEKKLPVYLTSKQFSTQVNGNVTGDYTGKAMSDLKVIVLNPDGTESGLKAVTGFDGDYSITPVPKGERTVIVKMNNEVISRQNIYLNDLEQEFNVIVPETFKFRDNRDGHRYLAMRIGNQTWMAENLAFLPEVSPPADQSLDDPKYYVYDYEGESFEEAMSLDNFREYGVLYNYTAAKEACPDGWHLPSDKEWQILEKNMGMSSSNAERIGWRHSGEEAIRLKSADGWTEDGNGDNSSGFNALPAGIRNGNGQFNYSGRFSYFWTSSTHISTNAWSRHMLYASDGVFRAYSSKRAGLSVRCIKDVKRVSANDDVGPK